LSGERRRDERPLGAVVIVVEVAFTDRDVEEPAVPLAQAAEALPLLLERAAAGQHERDPHDADLHAATLSKVSRFRRTRTASSSRRRYPTREIPAGNRTSSRVSAAHEQIAGSVCPSPPSRDRIRMLRTRTSELRGLPRRRAPRPNGWDEC